MNFVRRSLENCFENWPVDSFFLLEDTRFDSHRMKSHHRFSHGSVIRYAFQLSSRTGAAFKRHSLTELFTGGERRLIAICPLCSIRSINYGFFSPLPPVSRRLRSRKRADPGHASCRAHTLTHFNFSIDMPDTDTYRVPSFIFRDKRMFFVRNELVPPIFRTPARQSGLKCPTVD